jgi:NADH:ubiquinone oxidoreductase subunit 4 (subunit M)
MHSSWWLTLLLVVPLVGAIGAAFTRKREGRAYVIAIGASAVELVLALVVAFLYNDHVAKAQTFDFATRHVLAAPFGLAYDVSIDGISLLMVVFTALTVLLALLGARDRRQEPAFVSWMLLLTCFTMGSFLAHDLLEFFIFFELTLIPCYFIISQWGGKERSKAALKFFIYTFTGSAFLLIGILYLAFAHQHQFPRFGAHVLLQRALSDGDVPRHRRVALHRLRHRLRGEGADLALPHVVADHLRRGPDGGVDRDVGAARQARHLRTAALRGRDSSRWRW